MKRTIVKVVIGVLLIAIVVGGYFGFTRYRQSFSGEESVELTAVQKVITKNLDSSYPATPREVVKFYNRILACFYNESYSETELYALGDQARELFDEELLANNPRDQYFADLQAEIDDYHDAKRVITNSGVCDTNDVTFQTVDGRECAYVSASYFVGEESGYSRTYEMYVLRKDEAGRWKILAYYQIDEDAFDD